MKSIVFIVWLLLTFMLCISVIGWFLLAADTTHYENIPSTWMKMGKSLLNSILEK